MSPLTEIILHNTVFMHPFFDSKCFWEETAWLTAFRRKHYERGSLWEGVNIFQRQLSGYGTRVDAGDRWGSIHGRYNNWTCSTLETSAENQDLLLRSDVRWLSKGKEIVCFCDLREEITTFLHIGKQKKSEAQLKHIMTTSWMTSASVWHAQTPWMT